MNTFLHFFPMFAIHMCEKICFFLKYLSGTIFYVCFCVCTWTNQLVSSTEVTRLNFLNPIVMGQINQCGFQSHVAIDRYCIFLEINTFELSWVELATWYSFHTIIISMQENGYIYNGLFIHLRRPICICDTKQWRFIIWLFNLPSNLRYEM